MRSRAGKSTSAITPARDLPISDRKLTWADLGSDDEVSRALGIRLTYSKWRRKLKGEKEPHGKDENTLEDDTQITAGLKALDGDDEAGLDVTSLVVKKKRASKADSSVGELSAAAQPHVNDPLTTPLTSAQVLSSPHAALDDSAELSDADLNLLMTTLSRLSHTMAINEAPLPPPEVPLPEPDDAPSFPPMMTPPSNEFFRPPPVPYCGPTLLPHWPSDDYTYVGPQNLTAWRHLLTTLAHSEPATLAAQLQSGLLSAVYEPPQMIPEPAPPLPLFEPSVMAPYIAPPRVFERRVSAPRVSSVRRPPSEGRFKQIARGKSTPEYLQYIRAVPKEMRRAGVDPATPRVEGTSWREFQAEVRAWKISLHRKSEALNRCGEERPQPTPCPQGCT